jgi:ribonuclease VapC
LIVVDTSALVSILLGEAGSLRLSEKLASDPDRVMSVASYLEAGTVIAGRLGRRAAAAPRDLDIILGEAGIRLVAVDEAQARIALHARIRYGRGFGSSAKLNYGDCFAYALAKALDAPLLYVGDDFTETDVTSAL